MKKETITMADGRLLVYYWFNGEGCGCTGACAKDGKEEQCNCGCSTPEQTS